MTRVEINYLIFFPRFMVPEPPYIHSSRKKIEHEDEHKERFQFKTAARSQFWSFSGIVPVLDRQSYIMAYQF